MRYLSSFLWAALVAVFCLTLTPCAAARLGSTDHEKEEQTSAAKQVQMQQLLAANGVAQIDFCQAGRWHVVLDNGQLVTMHLDKQVDQMRVALITDGQEAVQEVGYNTFLDQVHLRSYSNLAAWQQGPAAATNTQEIAGELPGDVAQVTLTQLTLAASMMEGLNSYGPTWKERAKRDKLDVIWMWSRYVLCKNQACKQRLRDNVKVAQHSVSCTDGRYRTVYTWEVFFLLGAKVGCALPVDDDF